MAITPVAVMAMVFLVGLVAAELGYNYRLVNLMAEGGSEDALNSVSSFGKWAAAFGFGLFAMQCVRMIAGPALEQGCASLFVYVFGLVIATLFMRVIVWAFFALLPYAIPEQTKHDAVRVVQIRESGARGALKHPDLWRGDGGSPSMSERIARSNIAMLLVGDAWKGLHTVARERVSKHLHEKTHDDVEKLVVEIESEAAPVRPHYEQYRAANTTAREKLDECIALLTDDTTKVRQKDKAALARLIGKLPPADRKVAQKEQASVYYRYRRTVVRGRDLPPFMTYAEFQAFWEPHVQRRVGKNASMRRHADRQVQGRWRTYQAAMGRLQQQMSKAEHEHSTACTGKVADAFKQDKRNERRLDMNLGAPAFILATVEPARRAQAVSHLEKVVDAAHPDLGIPALRVKDLPVLDGAVAVRAALNARIATAEKAWFKSPTEHSEEVIDDYAMAIIGRPLALVLSTLSLLLNLGNLLGGVILWHARLRRADRPSALRLLGPVLLIGGLALAGSPFAKGGEFDRILDHLSDGGIGSPGRAWGFALRSEPAVWTLGAGVCFVAEWICPSATPAVAPKDAPSERDHEPEQGARNVAPLWRAAGRGAEASADR